MELETKNSNKKFLKKRWLNHYDKVYEVKRYCQRTRDFIIFLITGVAIYKTLDTLHTLKLEKIEPTCIYLAIFSIILLALSLICILFSHHTSSKVMHCDIEIATLELNKLDGHTINSTEKEKYEAHAKKNNTWTNCLNISSIICLIIGIILLLVFYCYNLI